MLHLLLASHLNSGLKNKKSPEFTGLKYFKRSIDYIKSIAIAKKVTLNGSTIEQ